MPRGIVAQDIVVVGFVLAERCWSHITGACPAHPDVLSVNFFANSARAGRFVCVRMRGHMQLLQPLLVIYIVMKPRGVQEQHATRNPDAVVDVSVPLVPVFYELQGRTAGPADESR